MPAQAREAPFFHQQHAPPDSSAKLCRTGHDRVSVSVCAGGGELAAGAPGDGVCAQPQGHGQDGAHPGPEGPAGGQVLPV